MPAHGTRAGDPRSLVLGSSLNVGVTRRWLLSLPLPLPLPVLPNQGPTKPSKKSVTAGAAGAPGKATRKPLLSFGGAKLHMKGALCSPSPSSTITYTLSCMLNALRSYASVLRLWRCVLPSCSTVSGLACALCVVCDLAVWAVLCAAHTLLSSKKTATQREIYYLVRWQCVLTWSDARVLRCGRTYSNVSAGVGSTKTCSRLRRMQQTPYFGCASCCRYHAIV